MCISIKARFIKDNVSMEMGLPLICTDCTVLPSTSRCATSENSVTASDLVYASQAKSRSGTVVHLKYLQFEQ